jgi:hypothetical protein
LRSITKAKKAAAKTMKPNATASKTPIVPDFDELQELWKTMLVKFINSLFRAEPFRFDPNLLPTKPRLRSEGEFFVSPRSEIQ